MSRINSNLPSFIHYPAIIAFWVFFAGKVMGGVFFSAWSWWWVLFPIIPFVAWVIQQLGIPL